MCFVFTCTIFVLSRVKVENGSRGPGGYSYFVFRASLALKEMQTRGKCSTSEVSGYKKVNVADELAIGGCAHPDPNGMTCVAPQPSSCRPPCCGLNLQAALGCSPRLLLQATRQSHDPARSNHIHPNSTIF